ncbi:MAG: PHB depolymerase family esterase [Rhizomicrobium sp.]
MRFDRDSDGAGKPSPIKARPAALGSPLTEVTFAPNPGNLRMFQYLPPGVGAGAPLVVILHGCGQTAAGYDLGAGWSQLADQLGFALLAPEQKAVNNPGTCFNWFNPEDVARGQGEAASIAGMIGAMVETHRFDVARIFITGLSAGGAMTAVMLASYPEMFAGGAIIGGLAFGSAQNVRDALESMRSAPLRMPSQWGDLVRAASEHKGAWPKVSIWHGGLDGTVNINNAQASVAQWADLHGLSLMGAAQEMTDGALRLSWDEKLEVYTLPALGHGTPIDSRDVGQAAPFILEAGISSTRRIAEFWGLRPAVKSRPKPAPATPTQFVLPKIEAEILARPELAEPPGKAKLENVIVRALKAAGLIRR